MNNTSSRSPCRGLALPEIADLFSTGEGARHWIKEFCWPSDRHCLHCGSFYVQCNIKHRSKTHRCRDCANKPQFAVRIGTIIHETQLKFREWTIGLCLYAANIKDVSSMHLHHKIDIGQKLAWFLLHRIRTAPETGGELFSDPVEVDQSCIGGKWRSMDQFKRKRKKDTEHGAVGKLLSHEQPTAGNRLVSGTMS